MGTLKWTGSRTEENKGFGVSSFWSETCWPGLGLRFQTGQNALEIPRKQYGVSMVSRSRTIFMVWGRYLIFGYVDPWGVCAEALHIVTRRNSDILHHFAQHLTPVCLQLR